MKMIALMLIAVVAVCCIACDAHAKERFVTKTKTVGFAETAVLSMPVNAQQSVQALEPRYAASYNYSMMTLPPGVMYAATPTQQINNTITRSRAYGRPSRYYVVNSVAASNPPPTQYGAGEVCQCGCGKPGCNCNKNKQ